MKKQINLITRAFLGTILLAACNQQPAKNADQVAQGTGSEERIDLIKHPMSKVQGINQITCAKDSMMSNLVKKPLFVTADSIRVGALKAMLDKALTLRIDMSANYLRALRIVYGLNETGDRMQLYYQPVLLKRRASSSGSQHIEFNPEPSPYYYYYNGNPKDSCFVRETNIAKVDTAKARYARHIRFRMRNGLFRPFYPGTSDTSDVSSCVFPFEEMYEMAIQNDSKYVYVINSAENIVAKNKETYLRHVMILGPDILEHRLANIFFRKYANLTHLCPPNCSQHFFDLK